MSALGLASLGVQCTDKPLGMASLGVFCGSIGGAGSLEGRRPGGYAIGLFERTIKSAGYLEGFEPISVEPFSVEESSRDMRMEAGRLSEALKMFEVRLLAMALELDKYQSVFVTEKAIRQQIMDNIEMLKLVEVKRREEEEIVALIMAIDE